MLSEHCLPSLTVVLAVFFILKPLYFKKFYDDDDDDDMHVRLSYVYDLLITYLAVTKIR